MFTHLTSGGGVVEATDMGVSSLIDTWLLVRDIEVGGERNRGLYVIKSRGMAHSNQVREFLITSRGVALQASLRWARGRAHGLVACSAGSRERAAALARRQDIARKQREIERRRAATRAQIIALEVELRAAEAEAGLIVTQDVGRERALTEDRTAMAKRRGRRDNGAGKATTR